MGVFADLQPPKAKLSPSKASPNGFEVGDIDLKWIAIILVYYAVVR